jgi:hypothetical protein
MPCPFETTAGRSLRRDHEHGQHPRKSRRHQRRQQRPRGRLRRGHTRISLTPSNTPHHVALSKGLPLALLMADHLYFPAIRA